MLGVDIVDVAHLALMDLLEAPKVRLEQRW
jgi:hypothetical protein